MSDHLFLQTLLLLGATVAVVAAFQRLQIPSSLAYLLVGVLFGPHTTGPVIDAQPIRVLAEFGIVFLLFTIGLNFSLPQIHALRHQVLGLGTAQVVLTTVVVGGVAWLMGLPLAAAFVVGAVFAQSSTTIISKQLAEQGEEYGRHGRLGVALSVFQDVTAVPFVVIIPVLGAATATVGSLAVALGWAFAKATVAFGLVLLLGRWALRPFFHLIVERRSTELFTLTVLFVSLIAAWATHVFGLSMAFGAFLVGMMLGETEFRLRVETAIRPFRDVLLGLFFIGMGMLFDLTNLPQIWHWALTGTCILLVVKTLLVTMIVRFTGIDALTAWRTGFLLAVGGEFGFALLAIALEADAIAPLVGQVALSSVLFSMIVASFFIRYNYALARLFVPCAVSEADEAVPQPTVEVAGHLRNHVIICGYGRIGQSVAHFLELEKIPYLALDMDPARVKEAHTAGEPVFYGDASEHDLLEAVGVRSAQLVVISHEDVASALKTLHHVRTDRPDLSVMVRTRDETHVMELRAAGATEVVAETLEASLMIAAHTLLLVNLPIARIVRRIQEQRGGRYQLLREYFRGDPLFEQTGLASDADQLRSVVLPTDAPAVGKKLLEFELEGVAITALVHNGERLLSPSPESCLDAGDVVVLFGPPDALQRAERLLLG